MNWLDSIYSDGSRAFVSNPSPKLNEEVKISIRVLDDSPVEKVFLRYTPNGAESILEMKKETVKNGLAYYSISIPIKEPFIHYSFYLTTPDEIYFYNQKGYSSFFIDRSYEFTLLADYNQPSWVKESVFYQIFPERFFNGNVLNDVKNGEYSVDGHETLKYEEWETEPLDYSKGFCLDFYGGDLEGITQKIPYLKDLGITALYLNPIFEAPSVHKYDCINYFHVDEHFGGDEALIKLSDELHKNGMKLILDISINHTGSNHIWFNKDGIFYDKSIGAYNNKESKERNYYFFKDDNSYKGWWDLEHMPTLNYTSNELRDIIYRDENSVIKKWLKPPFNIDGWRFDVADVFARNDNIQLNHEVWPEIAKAIKEENKEAYILAEDWDDTSEYLQGTEWDSAMNYFGSARIIRQFVGAPDLFMERYPELKKYKNKITAEEVRDRIETYLAKFPFVLAENQFNLIDSHDVSRLHNYDINQEDYLGALVLQFTLIGAPTIYYGDELGIGGTLGTNEGCRFPMPWNNFENNETYDYFKKLCHLKTSLPAFKYGGMKFLYAKDNVLALVRIFEDNTVLSIISTSNKDQEIELDLNILGCNGPISDIDLLGNNIKYTNDSGQVTFTVPAHKSYIINIS